MALKLVESILDKLVHVILGFIGGLVWWVDWKLSVMITLLFLVYEYVEEEKIHDELYHEVKEYTFGFILALLVSLILPQITS